MPTPQAPPAGCRGAILVEMLVALLLIAIGVTSLMAGMLSLPKQQKTTESWEKANLCAQSVLEELRSYVKPDYFTDAIPTAPVDSTVDPPIPWHLRGDSCDSCWALAEGSHDGTAAMPDECRAAPFSATLTYTVTSVTVNGLKTRQVDTQIQWQTPGQ